MKPKTELQKKVARLSENLSQINQKSIEWAYQNCLDNMAVQSRNRLYCLECGHKWNPKIKLEAKLLSPICPNCGKHLKLKENCQTIFKDSAYVSIITTEKGMQVDRLILVNKYGRKLTKPEYSWHEVMQRWIDEKGNITVMSLNVNGLAFIADAWNYSSELEIRLAYSQKGSFRHDIKAYKICPGSQVLPIIKRNGFNGFYHKIAPHILFSMILKNKKVELLLKSKMFHLLKTACDGKYTREKIEKYWPSIKICIRNKYYIKSVDTWFDYIELLDYFGKDLRNPHYVCPANLIKVHDKLVEKKMIIIHRQELEEMKEKLESDQKEYLKSKRKYFNLCFKNNDIIIKPLISVEEFMEEGDMLHHCIFTNEYYKKPDSLVLSARKDNKPLETIEVSLSKLKVVQCHGACNEPTKYHSTIMELINKNLDKIDKLKRSSRKNVEQRKYKEKIAV
jgi:hypothetical protein